MDSKNKRGFTLIEVLVVIIIFGVILAIVIPSVLKLVNDNSNRMYKAHMDVVEKHTELYAIRHKGTLTNYQGTNCYVLPYDQLKIEGLLEEEVECDGDIIITNDGKNNFSYQYYLSCSDSSGKELSDSAEVPPTSCIEVKSSRPTAPVITGGGNNWRASSVEISIKTEGIIPNTDNKQNDDKVSHYEYYVSTSSKVPIASTKATGTTKNKLTINEDGIRYVYYRTVSVQGLKSKWSDRQVVKIDKSVPDAPIVAGGNTTWNQNKTYTVTGPNSLSGIARYEYYIQSVVPDVIDTIPPTEPILSSNITSITGSFTGDKKTIDASGKYVYFRAVNNAGTKGKWTSSNNLYVNTALLNSLIVKNDTGTSYTLTPSFTATTTNYTLTVPYTISSLKISATAQNQTASISGLGTMSLNVGSNTSNIKVTGPDRTLTYKVTVTREKDTVNTLKSLGIEGYTISPAFDEDITAYTVTTEESSVNVYAEATSEVATVIGTGNKTVSWGTNTASVIVTAQNGDIKTYVITINNKRPTAPVITGGSSNWLTSTPTIKISTAGSAVSGIKHYEYYKTTSTTGPTDSTTATGTTSGNLIVSDEGTRYIYYRTVSNNGFKSVWTSSQTVKLDTGIPTAPVITGGSNSWSSAAKTISVSTASTSTSGINYYQYCESTTTSYSSCSWQSLSSGVTSKSISTNGTRYIFFRAINNAGTVGEVSNSQTTMIDTATPSVPTITVKKATSGTTVSSGSWSNENLNATLSGSSATSGISYYQYCTDTTNTCTPSTKYTSAISITSSKYIRYRAVSGSGKTGTVGSYHALIDTATPSVPTITVKKATSGTAVSSGSWSNENLSATLSGSSAISGISYYQYCTDTTNTCTPSTKYTSAISITSSKYVRYRAVSGSGKTGTTGSYRALVDTSNPTVTASVSGKTATFTIGDNIGVVGYGVNQSSSTQPTYTSITSTTSTSKSYTATAAGTYYVWVKDASGRTAKASFAIASNAFCSYAAGKYWEFNYKGSPESFTVPCNGTYKLEVYGAQGGSTTGGNGSGATGGKGGYSYGNKSLTKDSTIYIVVGGAGTNADCIVSNPVHTTERCEYEYPSGGYNGGGSGVDKKCSEGYWYYGGSGGGATHIGTFNNTLANHGSTSGLYIVAGGGAGGTGESGWEGDGEDATDRTYGGNGGGLVGGDPTGSGQVTVNGGGTQSSAGSGAGFGYGGNHDGGGGGGLYGGVGSYACYGGSGGSGYIGGVTNGNTENGKRSGNGYAKITLVSIDN